LEVAPSFSSGDFRCFLNETCGWKREHILTRTNPVPEGDLWFSPKREVMRIECDEELNLEKCLGLSRLNQEFELKRAYARGHARGHMQTRRIL
jgi:hypothetical protein